MSLNEKVSELLQRKPIILQLLRFAAIGVLNTTLDFLVLNFLSKSLGISEGFKLGGVNAPGFLLAVVQSYYWNKYWTFSSETITVWKNFWRLVAVGGLGAAAFAALLGGAALQVSAVFYLFVLFGFIIAQVILWHIFGFSKHSNVESGTRFVSFAVVSLVGLLINSALLALLSSTIMLAANPDLNKNIAKLVATIVSLIWNFVGYKLFVFKK